MARVEQSADDFDGIADELERIAATAREIAKEIRRVKMDAVAVHSVDVHNKHLPKLAAWAEKTQADVRVQIGARQRAQRDSSEILRSVRDDVGKGIRDTSGGRSRKKR